MQNGGKGQGRNSDSKRATGAGRTGSRSRPGKRSVGGSKVAGGPTRNANTPRKSKVTTKTASGPSVGGSMRIAKAMATAGLCSRRDAERWIADGRVSVNGRTIDSPALNVTAADKVVVDGKALPMAQDVRLWRFHKPRGLITTHSDPQGRETVFDKLPADMPRVISIGRLDYNTEGLLLLTTSGELARHIELPSTGWQRKYRVRGYGRVTQAELDELKEGIVLDGVRYGPIEATLDSFQSGNCWLSIGLREGKNREVRKVLGSLGLKVNRLIRTSFGPFELLDLPAGQLEEVPGKAIASRLTKDFAQKLGLPTARPDTPSPVRKQRARRSETGAISGTRRGER